VAMNFNFVCKLALIIALSVLSNSLKADIKILYQENCATCHSDDLKGGNAKSLFDADWQFGSKDSHVFRNIKFGIAHLGMPGFEGALNDDEIKSIVSYLKDKEKARGATKAGVVKKLETLDYDINAEVWLNDLEIPWAIDFINEANALLTERPGRLWKIKNGKQEKAPVKGTPNVLHEGQGGLLDVAIDPEYKKNGWIYLAYSHIAEDLKGERRPPAMTRVVRGQIKNNTWMDQQVLFEAPHKYYLETRHHYGCRIVFDRMDLLYFSIGERGKSDHAQDLSRPNGKTHRIHRDGSIPKDNPFYGQKDKIQSIWTFGNRNAQGLAVHPDTGEIWETEHGPMGGDELNLLSSGKNYGWPVITYGLNYNGTIITEEVRRPSMESPNLYWRPSIAVCGLDFYDGDLFPKWKNRLLVGALKYEEVRLLNIENDRVMHQEIILKNAGRVRDVASGPDGAIYVVLNQPGQVLRLTPINK
jgi:aldose sugar dehydrogenase